MYLSYESVFLVALGFEVRASCLLDRHCTTWVTHPGLFYFSHSLDKISHFCLGAGFRRRPFYLQDYKHATMHHHAQLICWDGVLINFLLGAILEPLTSRVAEIIDVLNHTQSLEFFLRPSLAYIYSKSNK
jgi:hypothetical protein